MKILTIALLYAVTQPGPDCGEVPFHPAIIVAAGGVHAAPALARVHTMSSRRVGPALAATHSLAGKDVSRDPDLLFYLESHVQALSDSSAGSLNPWVELHPVGAVQGVPLIGVPAADGGGQRAGHQGGGLDAAGGSHACS